jgi:hypothetical protein
MPRDLVLCCLGTTDDNSAPLKCRKGVRGSRADARNGTEERRRGDEKTATEAGWGEGDEKIWGKKKGHMSEIGHKSNTRE